MDGQGYGQSFSGLVALVKLLSICAGVGLLAILGWSIWLAVWLFQHVHFY